MKHQYLLAALALVATTALTTAAWANPEAAAPVSSITEAAPATGTPEEAAAPADEAATKAKHKDKKAKKHGKKHGKKHVAN